MSGADLIQSIRKSPGKYMQQASHLLRKTPLVPSDFHNTHFNFQVEKRKESFDQTLIDERNDLKSVLNQTHISGMIAKLNTSKLPTDRAKKTRNNSVMHTMPPT